MSKPSYTRIYLCCYYIGGKWQGDGEWFAKRRAAEELCRKNERSYQWPWRVVPLDVPTDALRVGRKEKGGG